MLLKCSIPDTDSEGCIYVLYGNLLFAHENPLKTHISARDPTHRWLDATINPSANVTLQNALLSPRQPFREKPPTGDRSPAQRQQQFSGRDSSAEKPTRRFPFTTGGVLRYIVYEISACLHARLHQWHAPRKLDSAQARARAGHLLYTCYSRRGAGAITRSALGAYYLYRYARDGGGINARTKGIDLRTRGASNVPPRVSARARALSRYSF